MMDLEISAPTVQNEAGEKSIEKQAKPAKKRKVLNNKRTALYRYFNDRQELLYVGISVSAIARMSDHSCEARWFRKARFVTIEWFFNRWAALEAEARAIYYEYPRYNIGHVLFDHNENLKRRALAREGKWVKPPKPEKEKAERPRKDNSTLGQRLAKERRTEKASILGMRKALAEGWRNQRSA